MSLHLRCMYLLEFNLCANCNVIFSRNRELDLPVHILFLLASPVFTFPPPPPFSLCEPWQFVKGLYQLELSTPANSVSISKNFKVAVRENVHKAAAFLHSLLLLRW